VLPYFERQQKRWCGLHCLNALEQRPAFDRKQLKAFADDLFLMCAAIEEDTAAEGRRGRAGRVRAPASHAFGSAVEGNLDVQVSKYRLWRWGMGGCVWGACPCVLQVGKGAFQEGWPNNKRKILEEGSCRRGWRRGVFATGWCEASTGER
jgi:hypothetical protein